MFIECTLHDIRCRMRCDEHVPNATAKEQEWTRCGASHANTPKLFMHRFMQNTHLYNIIYIWVHEYYIFVVLYAFDGHYYLYIIFIAHIRAQCEIIIIIIIANWLHTLNRVPKCTNVCVRVCKKQTTRGWEEGTYTPCNRARSITLHAERQAWTKMNEQIKKCADGSEGTGEPETSARTQ